MICNRCGVDGIDRSGPVYLGFLQSRGWWIPADEAAAHYCPACKSSCNDPSIGLAPWKPQPAEPTQTMAQAREMHEALRGLALCHGMTPGTWCCMLCDRDGTPAEPERHRPGCLAAPAQSYQISPGVEAGPEEKSEEQIEREKHYTADGTPLCAYDGCRGCTYCLDHGPSRRRVLFGGGG